MGMLFDSVDAASIDALLRAGVGVDSIDAAKLMLI